MARADSSLRLEGVDDPKSILVVDDQPAIRLVAEQLLSILGHRVTTASDGEDALKKLSSLPDVDLILTDVTMPRLGGVAMASAARRARPGIRIAFMSGHIQSPADAHLIRTSGAVLLQKPFTAETFIAAVMTALDSPGAPAE